MTRGLIHKLTGALIACLMALAMTVSAYAHKLPAGDDLALQEFILAGGNLNELCGDGMFAPGDCPLCRLTDAATPPEPPQGVSLVGYRFVRLSDPAQPASVPQSLAWSRPEARGPPSV